MRISLLITSTTRPSVSITNVQRLARPLHPRDAHHAADGGIGVGEQRVVEPVLVGELLLLVDGVATDADPLRAERCEFRSEIAEVTALLRAAVCHRGGIEEQHDRALGEELAQRARRPRLVAELEVRDDVSAFHPGNVSRLPRSVGQTAQSWTAK